MFRFLISLAISENLDMRLMDVVTTYLYGLYIYENPLRIQNVKSCQSLHCILYSIKLQRPLYGLKQSVRM